jgi:hypothetical protein
LDSDTQLWKHGWTCAAAVLIAFCLAGYGCEVNSNGAIVEAVKAGADPIAARCAINGTDKGDMCVAHVLRPKAD